MKTAAVIYTLITITNGATVHQESGFKSLRTCEEAKSLALYGLSIDDKAARDAEAKRKAEEARVKEAERKAAWERDHPPRMTRNSCEDRVSVSDGTLISSGCPSVRRISDGVVQDVESPLTGWGGNFAGSEKIVSYNGGYVTVDRSNEIKAALCVIEPERD